MHSATPAATATRAIGGRRRRQGFGRDGARRRRPLAGAAQRPGRHPLRPRRALPAHRDRRGGASGARRRRAGRGRADHGAGRRTECRRPGAMPDFRRWFGAAAAPPAQPDPGAQAGDQPRPAQVGGQYRRDQLRAPPPVGDQGRATGRRLPSGARRQPADLRRAWRRSLRDRLRPDRRRPDDLRRRAGHPAPLRHRRPHPRRFAGGRGTRPGQGAGRHRAAGGPPRPAVCPALRAAIGRRNDGDGARLAQCRVPAVTGPDARRPPGHSRPGRRYRWHRRPRGNRRRAARAGYAGARLDAGHPAARGTRQQRRPRLLRRARRRRGDLPDADQRQRFPGHPRPRRRRLAPLRPAVLTQPLRRRGARARRPPGFPAPPGCRPSRGRHR